MIYKKILLGAAAFFVSSFVIQGILGFVIAGEYFLSIPIMREAPIFALSLSHTVLSGIGFALLYPLTRFDGTPVIKGLKYGLLIGLIMVPFIALDLPGRFTIPSVGTWILTQGILSVLHFAVSGVLVGLIYKGDAAAA
ncbi:MAG: hypothetical protein ACI9EW_000880 [Cellvibrionaceae bacterium]|jgi:hypothetical protein